MSTDAASSLDRDCGEYKDHEELKEPNQDQMPLHKKNAERIPANRFYSFDSRYANGSVSEIREAGLRWILGLTGHGIADPTHG